jgi:hypothetical protein
MSTMLKKPGGRGFQKLTRQEAYLYPSLPLLVRQMNSALRGILKD